MLLAQRSIAELETMLETAKGRQRDAIVRILAALRDGVEGRPFIDVRLPPPPAPVGRRLRACR